MRVKFAFLLFVMLAGFLFAENNLFEITPRSGPDRDLVPGATVYIVRTATGVRYDLAEYSGAKAGTYYRANVPYGTYSIYVNGVLVKSNHPFGIDRPYQFIEAVDSDGDNKIETAGLEDSSVTWDKLSESAKQHMGYGTTYNAPDDVTLKTEVSGSDTLIVADTTNTMATRTMVLHTVHDSNIVIIAGRQVNVLSHLEHNNFINVKDYGAVGDEVTDDTDAIQRAIDSVTAHNETPYGGTIRSRYKLMAEGTFKISSTVYITCDVDFSRATFVVGTAFADTAIVVGARDGSSYLKLIRTYLPEVKVSSKVEPWKSGSVGVVVKSLVDSRIEFGEVWYFEKGIVITTHASKGCSYNDFFLSSIRDNKIGLHIYPASSGWTNENNFYGGRIRIDSDFSDTTGTVLLHLTGNNNSFFKLCLEGGRDETKIWLDGNSYGYGCTQNTFYNLRPESPYKWTLLADGSVFRNTFFRGYIANWDDEVNYITANGATAEAVSVMLPREEITVGTSPTGIKKYQNITSSGYPIISFYALETDPKVYPDSAVGQLNATGFQFKRGYTYTDPYIKADASAGNHGGLRFNVNSKNISDAPYLSGNWGGGTGEVEIAVHGALIFPDNAYNDNWLILGSYFFWVDGSGNLRINNGKPTSDTDGTIVGQQ